MACAGALACRAGACVDPVTALVAGQSHACALRASGTVDCWGENAQGQLGNGTTTRSTTPVRVMTTDRFVALGAARQTTCGIRGDRTLACWGRGDWGELGDGTSGRDRRATTPQAVSGLSDVRAISGGHAHLCAVDGSGNAWCWGDGRFGQIGDGATLTRLTPATRVGVSRVSVAPSPI